MVFDLVINHIGQLSGKGEAQADKVVISCIGVSVFRTSLGLAQTTAACVVH